MPTINDIKKLREETGLGAMDCKRALLDAKGNFEKAKEILKERGFEKAAQKSERRVCQGVVESYSHLGKVGVILELNSETDFVARSPEFKNFAHDLVLQIASMAPKSIEELLKQPFIKDETKTIKDLLTEKIAKTGENILIKRFERWELGE